MHQPLCIQKLLGEMGNKSTFVPQNAVSYNTQTKNSNLFRPRGQRLGTPPDASTPALECANKCLEKNRLAVITLRILIVAQV